MSSERVLVLSTTSVPKNLALHTHHNKRWFIAVSQISKVPLQRYG